MIIMFYLMLLGLSCYFVYKFIWPELQFELPSFRWPFARKALIEDVVSHRKPHQPITPEPVAVEEWKEWHAASNVKLDTDVLEQLLKEKNNEIDNLQKSLEAERKHRYHFQKTQQLLQEEIVRLKNEIKHLRKGV